MLYLALRTSFLWLNNISLPSAFQCLSTSHRKPLTYSTASEQLFFSSLSLIERVFCTLGACGEGWIPEVVHFPIGCWYLSIHVQFQMLQTLMVVCFLFRAETEQCLSPKHRHKKKNLAASYPCTVGQCPLPAKSQRRELADKCYLAFCPISVLIIGHLLCLQSST